MRLHQVALGERCWRCVMKTDVVVATIRESSDYPVAHRGRCYRPIPDGRFSHHRSRIPGPLTRPDFRILSIADVDTEAVVEALSAVFGPRSLEWFKWKHIDNPSGRSLGWVAVDEAGIAGVRLFQRWSLSTGNHDLSALRPVDTMTLPRARRRGIFSSLLNTALDELRSDSNNTLIFNTPNQASRGGYAKSGWTLLPVIRHGHRFTTPGVQLGTRMSVEALNTPFQGTRGLIETVKSKRYLDWRYDPRAGHRYRAATDDAGCEGASIIYRVQTRRRIRRMILLETFGSESPVRQLVAATARSAGAAITILATGAGTANNLKPHFLRGSSTLAVLPLTVGEPDPLRLESWSLSLGDLEDVL